MPTDRSNIALALMGAAFLTYVAISSPALIPAIGVGLSAFLAALAFLKM
ncbi:hypothetical protein [Streptomyces sp. NBC_01669]|nr:hypothetical protein [Streptomyces sp. NBC_01669]MCX4538326.1 hypothetical protein [Streptomyces sp. NBC_01669]